MEILDICKGKVLYNEGDEVHNLFYSLEGSFETSKTMQTYKTDSGVTVNYLPFEPSENINEFYHDFWKENKNLTKKISMKKFTEIEMLHHKPRISQRKL